MTKEEKAIYNKAYREANKDKRKAYREAYNEANKDKLKAYQEVYQEANKDKLKAYRKAYNETNKDKHKAYNKVYQEANKDKLKAYREANKDKIKVYNKIYKKANRKKITAQQKEYCANNINARIAKNLRVRLWDALKGNYKNGSAVRDLGCTIEKLKQYFENLFQEGMTRENYGEWHIDHIIPLSFFDLTVQKQFLIACHYTNLQPLWMVDNLCKGSKL